MPRRGKSFYIESFGPDDAALCTGLKWLVNESKRRKTTGLIAVYQKSILDNISRWSKSAFLPMTMKSGGTCSKDGVRLALMIANQENITHWDGPILAIYNGQDLLDVVDSLEGTADVLYIPFMRDDHRDWVGTWDAIPLNTGEAERKNDEASQEVPAIVKTALRRLTEYVNLSSGIKKLEDREEAIRTVETLYHMNADTNPELIRRFLVRSGWEPRHAKEVKQISEMIFEGRRPKGSKGRADKDLWGFWMKDQED